MNRRPIPWAIALIGALYFGTLIYWQQDALFGTGVEQIARDRATFGLAFSLVYVIFLLWCFMRDLPDGIKEIPFIGKGLKFFIWLAMVAICTWYARPSGDAEAVGLLFVGVLLMGIIAAMSLTCVMYSGEESSRLYALRRFVDVYPAIAKPDGHVRFNSKLWTTTFVLILYFAMTNVMLWGLSGTALDLFSGFRSIMAGASGTISGEPVTSSATFPSTYTKSTTSTGLESQTRSTLGQSTSSQSPLTTIVCTSSTSSNFMLSFTDTICRFPVTQMPVLSVPTAGSLNQASDSAKTKAVAPTHTSSSVLQSTESTAT